MEEICNRAIGGAGGPAKLAAALSERGVKITPQAISQWNRVPSGRVIVVEEITGISRHELRPDIFGAVPERVA
ncbi:transcriptional regulator [Stappia sp.]|uniref:transcriptional regulator n=1 Tax=Stappia sp. TaxID=1870903 RepID=UPI003C7AEC27